LATQEELGQLEADQSSQEMGLYEKYLDRFESDKEKVYFLKLTLLKKKDYVFSKGWADEKVSRFSFKPPKKRKIYQGMPKDEVLGSLGEPLEREIAGHPSHENERWIYSYKGSTKYIYFEDGVVNGWE